MMEALLKALLSWIWKAAQLLWGIAIGWSGVGIFTGQGSPLLFLIVLAVGLPVVAIRRWLKSRATVPAPARL